MAPEKWSGSTSFFLSVAVAGCTVSSGPPAYTCDPDPTVQGCPANADGFSCTGGDTPEQSDSSLYCSDGVPGNAGSRLYCCVTFSVHVTCAPDPTVQGCIPSSIGFSCTGGDTPDQGDPSLVCSQGVPGNAGSLLYCCIP